MRLAYELKRDLKSQIATSNDWHQNVMAALELVREEVQRADKQIRNAHADVDFWKVGKLNHNKAVEQSALGPKFRDDATAADSYCVFDDRQVAVVGVEVVAVRQEAA